MKTMMNRILLVSSFLFIFLVILAGCGPNNYDDCVLKNLKGINNTRVATAILITCREKFPLPPKEEKPSVEVPSEVLAKLDGRVEQELSWGKLKGKIDNQNEEWTITSITIVVFPYDTENKEKEYITELILKPFSVENIEIEIMEPKDPKWGWNIVSAKGYTN